MSDLRPRYYLRHDTPAGVRFAYPVSGVGGMQKEGGWPAPEPWTFSGGKFERARNWVISAEPLVELTRTRPGKRERDGWEKRDTLLSDGPVSPEMTALFNAAPKRPADQVIAHYAEHEAEHACWTCREFLSTYAPRYVQGPDVVEVQRFDDWQPLDAQLDEHPDRRWTMADESLAAIYGSHTAHLWPGYLTGLQVAVVAALEAHPLVGKVYHWTHKRGEIDARVDIPFEPARTKTSYEKDPFRPRRKAQPVTRKVWAISESVELMVPDEVRGASKAEALANWDTAVAYQVARFVPDHERAAVCGACSGHGVVTRDGL